MNWEQEVAWSVNMFRMMRISATWAVPRSGLIFQRTGFNILTLVAAMPWKDIEQIKTETGIDLPRHIDTEAKLLAWQREDLAAIAKRFIAGGIVIESRVDAIPLPQRHN